MNSSEGWYLLRPGFAGNEQSGPYTLQQLMAACPDFKSGTLVCHQQDTSGEWVDFENIATLKKVKEQLKAANAEAAAEARAAREAEKAVRKEEADRKKAVAAAQRAQRSAEREHERNAAQNAHAADMSQPYKVVCRAIATGLAFSSLSLTLLFFISAFCTAQLLVPAVAAVFAVGVSVTSGLSEAMARVGGSVAPIAISWISFVTFALLFAWVMAMLADSSM